MNKIITAAIAGAAGVGLLAGGAGTFALWNASASAGASSISSGSMTLTANNDGKWLDITNGRSATIDATTAQMVPGNTYQFTQTLNVGATGQDLKANLTYATQSITGSAGLLAATTKTLSVTSSNANIVAAPAPATNTYVVTPSSTTSTVNVVFTISLPAAATNTSMSGSLNIAALAFTLTQTAI